MKTGVFKVVGMRATQWFTCESGSGMTFWAKNGLSADRYNALFKWAKNSDGFWKQHILGNIEYENTGVGGTPINGILTSIDIK